MKTITIVAIIACLFTSCATSKGGHCDAYSNAYQTPTSFDRAEIWLDTIHNQNKFINVNNL